jgi:hypothetical protein
VSSVSNGLYFLTLPLVSFMRVIYASKGMSKKFGVSVIYKKYGILNRTEILYRGKTTILRSLVSKI